VPLTLLGTDGDDHLVGGPLDDFLTGYKGNDLLEGGEGNDTYYYTIGDGNTTIIDSGGDNDTLVVYGITSPIALVGHLHVTAQDGGFILTLDDATVNAKGIDMINIDGIGELTAAQLIDLGAQLG
jgi:Ca2+-binding RTX toxin-like protein